MGRARNARRARRAEAANAPPRVAAPAIENPWLVGPKYDLAVYASGLWSAAFVLVLARFVEPLTIWFVFNIVFTAAHYGPTWLRAYVDREERQRHGWSLYVFPPAVFAFAWLTRDRPEVFAFIAFFWDRWHAVMQNYGFMRLYDAKAGTRSIRRARLDFALLISSSLFILSLNMGLFTPLLAAFDSIGIVLLTTTTHVHAVQIVFGVTTAIVAIAWVIEARRVPPEQRRRQLPRLCFLITLVGGHALMNTTSNIFLLSSHEKVYHSLQYFALSWHYSRRRAEKTSEAVTGSLFRALFGANRWPLYLAVVAAWTVVAFLANQVVGDQASGPGLFTTLIGALALCHYYFDSFLWRVRRPEVRASL